MALSLRPYADGGERELLNDEAITEAIRPCTPQGAFGTRARRLQDIESDTGYDTRRRAPDGALACLSQTTVYDTC